MRRLRRSLLFRSWWSHLGSQNIRMWKGMRRKRSWMEGPGSQLIIISKNKVFKLRRHPRSGLKEKAQRMRILKLKVQRVALIFSPWTNLSNWRSWITNWFRIWSKKPKRRKNKTLPWTTSRKQARPNQSTTVQRRPPRTPVLSFLRATTKR